MELQEYFGKYPKAALGFSGGVDSSYLLYAGIHYGAQIRAYYVKTAFQPEFELEDAKRLAAELGADFKILEMDILSVPDVADNPPDRCYHCKTRIFGRICEEAAADGFTVVFDGTNASDEAGDRPGMRALTELSVRSPLRECGLTKAAIRRLSKEAGLFTWDKPAYACLATRVPAGEALSAELLGKVEGAEDALARLGYSDFRVRVFHGAARLQLAKGQMERAAACRQELVEAVRPWFDTVLLDLLQCR